MENQVLELIAGTYGKSVADLNRDTRFIEDLSANSLSIVGLIANIEEELDVMIPLTEAAKLKTVGDMIDFVLNEG